MEDGPAKRTRSATGIERSEDEIGQPLLQYSQPLGRDIETEIFKTPTNTPSKSKKLKKKLRTPSGHTLSNSVEDIRNFFIQNEESKKSSSAECLIVSGSQNYEVPLRNPINRERMTSDLGIVRSIEQSSLSGESVKCSEYNKDVNTDKLTSKLSRVQLSVNREDINITKYTEQPIHTLNQTASIASETSVAGSSLTMDQTKSPVRIKNKMLFAKNVNKETLDEICQQEAIYRSTRQKKIHSESKNMNMNTDQEKDQASFGEICEAATGDGKDIEAIDIKIVYGMFQEIKTEMKRAVIIDGESRMANLEERQDSLIDTMIEMKAEMIEYKQNNKLLSGVVSHLSETISNLEGRVEKMEMNNMKKSAVITGLTVSRNKRTCMSQVEEFISTEMGTECNIDDVFYLSQMSTSPFVITFASMYDKTEVFANLKNLKGVVNEHERPISINHYLPPEMNETKRREHDILKQNEKLVTDKLNMFREKGRLIIEEQAYEKAVKTPTVHDILSMNPSEFNQAMASDVKRGKTITEKQSSFTGYAISVRNHQQVADAYKKLKVQFASMSHIVCSYRIPGNRQFECEDYCDDGDIGCGCTILEWMVSNDITCRAIFVVRSYGKVKLGPLRFKCYVEAAKAVIEKASMNTVNNTNQGINLTRWTDRRQTTVEDPRSKDNEENSRNPESRSTTRRKENYLLSKSDRRKESYRRRTYQPRGASSARPMRGKYHGQNRNGQQRDMKYNEAVRSNLEDWPSLQQSSQRHKPHDRY